jgi:AcrR family transcriptional regulator
MSKKNISKELIITTAFNIWGNTCFRDTSLSLITNKMNITKPALYRYFRNKEQLLQSMKDFFTEKFICLEKIFLNESLDKKNEKIIYLYIKTFFEFFAKNHFYFLFFIVFFAKESLFNNKEVQEYYQKEKEIFTKIIKTSNTWLKSDEAEYSMRYIYSTGIFILFSKLQCNIKKKLYKTNK